MDPRTDAELVDASRHGDRAATEALLGRHAPALLRFANRRCDDPVDADDVVQEALVAAVRALPELRSDAAVGSWLFTIARRACGRLRRRRRHAPAEHEIVRDAEPASPTPTPDAATAEKELSATLDAGIRSLRPRDREVLLLRDVEGLSAPEVAEVLGLGIDAVKSRLHRARAALREQVAPTLAGHGPACPDIVGPFSRFLEGDIDAEACAAMKAHVAECPSCNAACASLRRTVELCRVEGTGLAPELQERLRGALQAALGRVG